MTMDWLGHKLFVEWAWPIRIVLGILIGINLFFYWKNKRAAKRDKDKDDK